MERDVKRMSRPEFHTWQYLNVLNLDWQTLHGKRVLDIGADSGDFAYIAKTKGITVVSLDDSPRIDPRQAVPFIKGDGLNLPFTDNSFDFIVAAHVTPVMIKEINDWRKLIQESSSVLRDDGELRFGPGSAKINLGALTYEDWDILIKSNDGNSLTPEENRRYQWLRERTDSNRIEVDNLLKKYLGISYDELNQFAEEERSNLFNRFNLKIMQEIDPNISMHKISRKYRRMYSKGLDVYFVYKKAPAKKKRLFGRGERT